MSAAPTSGVRPPMSRRRKAAVIAVLMSVAGALIVGGLEGGAWLVGLRPHRQRIYDAELGWTFRPNTVFQYMATGGRVHASIDSRGFRPSVQGANGDAPVIVALGDSYTFGGESADDQTWPEHMARALSRDKGAVRAINLGMMGYSPLQSLLAFRRTLKELPPSTRIQAVVFFFFINDPGDNFDSERPHLDPAEFASESGEPASPRILPPRPPPPFTWRSVPGKIRTRSAFLNGIKSRAEGTTEADFRAGGQLHEKLFAYQYREFLQSPVFQRGMRHVLREMQRECAARGCPLYVASFVMPPWDDPSNSGKEYRDLLGWSETRYQEQIASYGDALNLLVRLTEESGARFLDLRGTLNGMRHREYVAAPSDWHYSPAANARIGAAIADRLRPSLAATPR